MRLLTLISLAAGAYIFWRAVCPLRCGWAGKTLLGLLLLAVGLFFQIMRAIGGPQPFAPDVPGWLNLALSWGYMSYMAYFLGLVGCQLISCLVLNLAPAWRALPRENKRSYANAAHLLLLVAAMLLVGIGEYNALKPPAVKELALELPVRKPLKIALLTDLHADAIKRQDFIRRVVELTNEQQPDLVLIVGDFVDGSVAQRGAELAPLRELQAPAYAVPGNHEYYSGYTEWAPFLASLGLHMLHNEHLLLDTHGIVLAGVTDPAARVFGLESPDIDKALAGAPEGAPIILLAHQPQIARMAEPAGVALQLSGHTHGGLMPGLAQITAAFNCGFVEGLYHTGRMLLYVSPGTSLWSGIPLRLGVPAEITLITIAPFASK